MASLSDRLVQREYAKRFVAMQAQWDAANDTQRPQLVLGLVQWLSQQAGIPCPKFEFAPISSWGQLDSSQWMLKLHQNFNQALDETWLINMGTNIYHEMRHAEQFTWIGYGILTGELSTFGLPKNLQGLVNGWLAPPALIKFMRIPPPTAIAIYGGKLAWSTFTSDKRRQVTAIYRSIYGANRQHRHTTLAHALVYTKNDRGYTDQRTRDYRHLPEEADAYRVQSEVYRELKGLYGDAALGDDYGLNSLFPG